MKRLGVGYGVLYDEERVEIYNEGESVEGGEVTLNESALARGVVNQRKQNITLPGRAISMVLVPLDL